MIDTFLLLNIVELPHLYIYHLGIPQCTLFFRQYQMLKESEELIRVKFWVLFPTGERSWMIFGTTEWHKFCIRNVDGAAVDINIIIHYALYCLLLTTSQTGLRKIGDKEGSYIIYRFLLLNNSVVIVYLYFVLGIGAKWNLGWGRIPFMYDVCTECLIYNSNLFILIAKR